MITISNPYGKAGSCTYEPVATFCPACGASGAAGKVVRDTKEDFMLGYLYFCLGCDATWHLPEGDCPTPDKVRKPELDAIRAELIKQGRSA